MTQKGHSTGMNTDVGKTGEKYVSYDKSNRKYKVTITFPFGKQKTIGYSTTLEGAIGLRDKYLNFL
jgi:hypothetical protein